MLRAVSENAEFFYVGKLWLDESERLINTHGSGILFYDGVLYWLGEYKEGFSNKAEIGVTCYSSKKLYDLTFRGMGLPVLNQIDSMIQPIGEKVIPG